MPLHKRGMTTLKILIIFFFNLEESLNQSSFIKSELLYQEKDQQESKDQFQDLFGPTLFLL